MRLDEDAKAELVSQLLELNGLAGRVGAFPANDEEPLIDAPRLRALTSWWWLPRCPLPTTSSRWRAFVGRRSRFAKGLGASALLPLALAAVLPDLESQWMFFGFAVTTAFAAAWQWDVANRELQVIEMLETALKKRWH